MALFSSYFQEWTRQLMNYRTKPGLFELGPQKTSLLDIGTELLIQDSGDLSNFALFLPGILEKESNLRKRLSTVQIYFCAFLPLNIFIPYLVDFFVDFGIDLSNNEFKYSSETSAKRDSAAIVFLFKAGASHF